jgi:hypothetical protein
LWKILFFGEVLARFIGKGMRTTKEREHMVYEVYFLGHCFDSGGSKTFVEINW